MSGMVECGWQRLLLPEALTNTMRVSRGALCRLLQPLVAKLHQSCWPVSNNPGGESFLSWGGTNIRLEIILLSHSAYCLYLFSLPSSVFLHLFLFILFYHSPTLYSSSYPWWGGNSEAPPCEETLECGQKEGREVARFPSAIAKGNYLALN